MLVDCHTHIESFPDSEISGLLNRAHDSNVGLIITAGTTMSSSLRSVELSNAFQKIFSGIGLHPMDLDREPDHSTIDQLTNLAASSPKTLVLSEIGLDFMEGAPDRAIQFSAFRKQIGIAREIGLPIVFHSRESHTEVLRVLREERAYEVGGIMHYFQADQKIANEVIDLGFYISLARPLLRIPELQKLASNLPLEKIVLETDSAPQPFKNNRDNWTEPKHIKPIAQKLADIQNRPINEVERVTTSNIKKLLGERWKIVADYVDE
ncbi:MAG: TatD family hydrolase [Chloroflexota bacterium]|nr:TatD family hydrolase [Chloroflexota bacterium]